MKNATLRRLLLKCNHFFQTVSFIARLNSVMICIYIIFLVKFVTVDVIRYCFFFAKKNSY